MRPNYDGIRKALAESEHLDTGTWPVSAAWSEGAGLSYGTLRALMAERDYYEREYSQFLADLGSIVAGVPVEPAEALRRVEALVRERETGR